MIKNRTIVRDLYFFFFMVVIGLTFWRNNSIVGSLLLIEFLVAMAFFYNKIERVFFIFIGLIGIAGEIVGSFMGIWTYALPNLITVPVWIFFCWGFTFMLFHSIYLNLKN